MLIVKVLQERPQLVPSLTAANTRLKVRGAAGTMPRPSVLPLCTWSRGAWYQVMVSSRWASSWFTLLRWVPGSARLAPRTNRLALRAEESSLSSWGSSCWANYRFIRFTVLFLKKKYRFIERQDGFVPRIKSHDRHLLPLMAALLCALAASRRFPAI